MDNGLREMYESVREAMEMGPCTQVAGVLRNEAIQWLEDHGYSVAQDLLAGMRKPDGQEVVDALDRIERHIEEGYRLGLCDQEIIIHDSLQEDVPEEYDQELVAVAREVYAHMKSHTRQELKTYLEEVHEKKLPEWAGWMLEKNGLGFEYVMDMSAMCELTEKREMSLWQ